MLSPPLSFHLKTWAIMMESTGQKTFRLLTTILPVPVTLVFILLLSSTLFAAGSFKVVRVIVGNTIKISDNIKSAAIRLIWIDPPKTSKNNEFGQLFSQTSTKHLARLALNKSVEIKSHGTDRYGRILGVVYCNGTNVNLEIVKAGLAEVYRGKPAKGFDNDPYRQPEKEARKAGRGMWSLGDRYVSPKEWRKMKK